MTIARRTYLFLAALFVFLWAGAPTEVEAQGEGLTCGWCLHDGDRIGSVEVGGRRLAVIGNFSHAFPRGGDECGWEGHDDEDIFGGPVCARCGGDDSHCHTDYWENMCHRPCGPEGDAVAALTEIEEALGRDEMTTVVAALRKARTGMSVEFLPDAGRIEIMLACDLDRAIHTIPVLPGARERLQAALILQTASGAE